MTDENTTVEAAERAEAAAVVETFYDRLLIEGSELFARLEKLRAFIGTQKYDELPLPDRELLMSQATYMAKYLEVLSRRRERAEENAPMQQVADSGPNA